MIKTIFFDFGNVIGFFDHARALSQLVRYTDMNATELNLVLYGGVILDDYEHGRISTTEYAREARLNGRLTCTEDEFLASFADIFWPNPEICDLIPKLRPHYRIVLASNTCDAHFNKFREMFASTLVHFDALGTSHTMNARKPHAAFYESAHRLANVQPGECLFLDDLPVNVEAAERFGWKGIVYRPDGTIKQKLQAAGVEIR